jgi:hypothetical protein
MKPCIRQMTRRIISVLCARNTLKEFNKMAGQSLLQPQFRSVHAVSTRI